MAALIALLVEPGVRAEEQDQPLPDVTSSALLDRANHLFYSGAYEASASLALDVRIRDVVNLEASELRTAALHFQMRRALGEPKDRGKAWKACELCQELMPVFLEEFELGRAAARDAVEADPDDDEALFLLGKLDLNHVWLQLATVGRKTGWGEFKEARASLKTLLERRPDHIRGKVAQADAPTYVSAEARFAVWDMQAREENFEAAVITAGALLHDFPDNAQLAKFIVRHEGNDEQIGRGH